MAPTDSIPFACTIQNAIWQPRSSVYFELEEVNKIKFYFLEFNTKLLFSPKEYEQMKKAYKAIIGRYVSRRGPFTRNQIIRGIHWRAQNIFPKDPTYEEQITMILDKFLVNFASSPIDGYGNIKEKITNRAQYLKNMQIPKKSVKALQEFNWVNMRLRDLFFLPPREPLKEIADALENNDDVAVFLRSHKVTLTPAILNYWKNCR